MKSIMNCKGSSILKLVFFLFLISGNVISQQLTKQEAIRLTLENNFGILIATNTIAVAKNNKGILNSGYLPTLTGNAGANYQSATSNTNFQGAIDQNTGQPRADIKIEDAETQRYNAGLNLNYTLFDGLGRFYNYKRLKEQYNLTELQARETIENTILQLFSVYYEVARLSENVEILEETLRISKERILRSNYQFEYGQNTKLNVLNAEVDVANDSINLLNTRQQLINTKRDLNVILDNDLAHEFEVDTIIKFIPKLELEEYLSKSTENNITLLQNESNIRISDYDIKVSKSGYLPSIGLTGSYGWNQNRNPPSTFFPGNISDTYTLGAGVSLTWNLFDGGNTITRVKNAKIALDNQEIIKSQIEKEVNRDIANALGNYENRLNVFKIQQQNVITNQNNFERSQERFKLGQITSIEFRQAQINLILAETNKNSAKYDAKIAELQLLQLTGQLLNIEF
ncbi:outer membrane protein TolC [Aquimarina sp. EL_43]|uniref:TolC family protein n=1 Tax=unclassified Aquimarina TaxID=2627091 RepID=UPI001A199B6C|nr:MULTISPECIES: TolC family protein [unclassified Aquimarina]MBG6130382.1 outer membrane protein TolC [Aquimarina sp. EL_35]MBG6149162.1 outer membrane protein TolC [Aquimarina sp. EL_32]MBG6168464.1 outer membrane protein TolC [Aquimarina sp. EL_43]